MKCTALCLLMLLAQTTSYDIPKPPTSRRVLLERVFMGGAAVTAASFGLTPDAALASGGSTAGKYTTIPIAKRRYYGRVQEAVHEFVSGPTQKSDFDHVVYLVGAWKEISFSHVKRLFSVIYALSFRL